jgi:hypothetical protein
MKLSPASINTATTAAAILMAMVQAAGVWVGVAKLLEVACR